MEESVRTAVADDGRELEIISLAEAKEHGLKRYFTGEPCKHGHVDERLVSTRSCRTCNLIDKKERDHKKAIESQRIKQKQRDHEEVELDKRYPNRISYEEAKAQNLKYYFTGRPCKNGHIVNRLVSTKSCIECEKENRIRNASSIKEIQAKWYQNNREKALAQQKEYAEQNRKKRNEYNNQWRRANPERRKAIERRHEEKRRDRRKVERDQRRKEDFAYLLKERYRDRILKAVKNNRTEKAYKTAELLGCTVPEFIEHLKGTMTEGMTWEDFIEGRLHLDHVRPIASYDLSKSEDQVACFHYSNYQILWKRDNLSKGAKYKGVDYRRKPTND